MCGGVSADGLTQPPGLARQTGPRAQIVRPEVSLGCVLSLNPAVTRPGSTSRPSLSPAQPARCSIVFCNAPPARASCDGRYVRTCTHRCFAAVSWTRRTTLSESGRDRGADLGCDSELLKKTNAAYEPTI